MINQERPILLCLSHLRWGGVWQRPQQLMTRLSQDFTVLFHEEPYDHETPESTPSYELWQVMPELTVLVPRLPAVPTGDGKDGYHAANWGILSSMLHDFLQQDAYRNRPLIVWCYTPMALPLVTALTPPPTVVAYDCMDELAYFHDAPAELQRQEHQLLERAQVVFCGGASMYRNRKDRHPNVHLHLSGVDADHFAQALLPTTTEPDDFVGLAHPRIGYWGVLDERIDWALLAQAAQARPDWHFVLVGPVAKIDPGTLPQAPNIHYIGHRAYSDLPRYATGFDIAMMPFALNEATRFISPTKTLEYMAAEKPIISTPIADVVDPYQGPVVIAPSVEHFISGIELLLTESEESRAERFATYRQWLTRWAWGSIATTMRNELFSLLEAQASAGNSTRELG